MDSRGYVHVYTGDGKGKTTAALGLALRAAGAGWRVFFAQFAKGMASSELAAIEPLSSAITVRQFGRACFTITEVEVTKYAPSRRQVVRARGYRYVATFRTDSGIGC